MRKLVLWLLLMTLPLAVITCKSDDDDNNNNPAPGTQITVSSPNGGESWAVGSSHTITWTDNGVGNVTLSYSTDAGTTWQEISANIANTHSASWTVPNAVSATCRVRVASAANAATADQSNSNFAIVPAGGEDIASGAVTTTTHATISTPAGAQIVVPEGAVPPLANGDPATVVFSVERTGDSPTPPTGETAATPVYRFGPEGFVFARAVEVAVPVGELQAGQRLGLYRINPTTQQPEFFGGRYDSTTQTVRAQTMELSAWFGAWSAPDPEAWGCLHIQNTFADRWIGICADSISLAFPARDAAFLARSGLMAFWSPAGHLGWASESDFFLPQGFYRMCVQYGTDTSPEVFTHGFADITIGPPTYSGFTAICPPWTPSVNDSVAGRCECAPTPTVPVGTGAVQVTLTWFSTQALDLDLWVTEPDSERCWYANPTTASGGQLDRDNLCANYQERAARKYFLAGESSRRTIHCGGGLVLGLRQWADGAGSSGAHGGAGCDPYLHGHDSSQRNAGCGAFSGECHGCGDHAADTNDPVEFRPAGQSSVATRATRILTAGTAVSAAFLSPGSNEHNCGSVCESPFKFERLSY